MKIRETKEVEKAEMGGFNPGRYVRVRVMDFHETMPDGAEEVDEAAPVNEWLLVTEGATEKTKGGE